MRGDFSAFLYNAIDYDVQRLIDGLALQTHVANVLRDRMPRRRLAHTDILARA